jgi:uncharacterized protein YdeI (YjbR/CyaY-like superfamily)
MEPVYFKSQEEFRKWLSENHSTASELVVGFYKVKSRRFNMTWSQSVDQALCYGWIDGIRRSVDDESYSIRFTPRRPDSVWSNINIKKVEELSEKGLMTNAGLDVFNKRKTETSGIYSFENGIQELPVNLLEIFQKNIKAWNFFTCQSPSYRKTMTHWIVSAKQEMTKLSRLQKVIEASENEKRIY